jgi:hypothetical protein
MEIKRILPFYLVVSSILLMLVALNLISGYIIYYVVITLILIFIFSIVIGRKNSFISIKKVLIKRNIFTLNYNDTYISGVAAKIIGKQEYDKNLIDLQKELNNLLNALIARNKNYQYLILTSINSKQASSSIIVYKECKDCENDILYEFDNILEIAKVVSPHIMLEPVPISNKALPLPLAFGNVNFARVMDIKMESPTIDKIIVNYDIELGDMLVHNQIVPTGIRSEDVLRHIGIFGSTGSGKSNTATIIANELFNKGFNVIILDWHGEYSNNLANYTIYDSRNLYRINPLKFNEVDDIIDILGDVLQLTDPQRFLLFLIISKLRKDKRFKLIDMLDVLRNTEDQSNWMREVKYALARKLYPLFTTKGKLLFSVDVNPEITDLLAKKGVVFNLSFINNIRLRKLYGLFILKYITDFYMSNKQDRKLLLIIEEAHNFFNVENDFIDKLISEIRKFGVGLCIISQSPSSISSAVMKNTNIKIIHSIKSDIDKKILRDSLSLPDNLYSVLDKLDVGEAILSAPNTKTPLLIKIRKT